MTQWLNTALGVLKTITIFDIADVLIVAYILYRGMLLLRRSRAAQVAKALLLLLLALFLSYVAQLNVINFVLGRAVELGALALVIVFQPELRRFLEQVGSGSWGGVFKSGERPAEMETAVVQVTAACASLSRDKAGALVVFERKSPLDETIRTGTLLDASVSAELLKNLFWDKAPLHDGAVIIRDGRLAGAGCVLPLSGNANLSRDLGMRHRAGIGVSESSDAVVVIVSEETGSISVAVGGMLKRHLAPETLERLLRNELIPVTDEAKVKKLRLPGLRKSRKGGADTDE